MSILGMVKRNFWRLVNSFNVIYDYEGYIWPHLEFCIQAWSPFLARDKLVLENVHRRATKLVCGLKNKSYEERLIDLGLTTLETRRLRGDLIETYKILHWKSHIDHCQLFEPVTNGHELRGHDFKFSSCISSITNWTSGNISVTKSHWCLESTSTISRGCCIHQLI